MTELFLGLSAGFAFGSVFTYCWWRAEIKVGRIIDIKKWKMASPPGETIEQEGE